MPERLLFLLLHYGGNIYMNVVPFISGPFIGAVIGYFTNYIAVKMLFHPYKSFHIGKFRVPFTPGIIPKRQPDMAKAIGNAVGNHLFTGGDLENLLISEEAAEKVSDIAVSKLMEIDGGNSINLYLTKLFEGTEIDEYKDKISDFLADQLVNMIANADIEKLLEKYGEGISEGIKKSLGMFSFMLTRQVSDAVLFTLLKKAQEYTNERGKEKIFPLIRLKADELTERPIATVKEKLNEERLKQAFTKVYLKAAPMLTKNILSNIHIDKVVENKICEMSVTELEKLCMSVMKRELNAIVSLGALIGFVIGILNIFI